MKVKILALTVIVLVIIGVLAVRPISIETVKKSMEKGLKENWGEEFEVYNIGTQSAAGKSFYVAQIIPKKYIGTNKEEDEYYITKAYAVKKSFGRSKFTGSKYGQIKLQLEGIEYLNPKLKELFGERIKLVPEMKFKEKQYHGLFTTLFTGDFKEALKKIKEDPDNYMMECKLYLYVFDRIDDGGEAYKRKKDTYEFVKYLNDLGIYKETYINIMFTDERILIPGFEKKLKKIRNSEKTKEMFINIVNELELEMKRGIKNKMLEKLNNFNTSTDLMIYGNDEFSSANIRLDPLYNEEEKDIKNFKNLTYKEIRVKLYNDSLINKYFYNKGR